MSTIVPPASDSQASITPYYEDDSVALYLGNAREVQEWQHGDVLITDPPYGSERASGYGRSKLGKRVIENDRDTSTRDFILALWGLRPAIVFGHPTIAEPSGPWDARLVWDKRFPGLGNGAWRWQHEMIYVRGKWVKSAPDFSVLSISRGPQSEARDRHPHAKPEALMSRLLDGAPGGVIVDPFAGSGTTLVTAKQLGRRAIGVELDERYCEVAAKRLTLDTLFGGAA